MVIQVNHDFELMSHYLITVTISGELSAWYRGKSNVAATKSNFNEYGLKMFVFTNADNC